jgi:sulfite reductase (NADPH) flavoprotein alpha-component
METVATVCGYCGVGCGMELHLADGAVTKATGRANHPANRGRLCTKGNTTADMLRAGGRLTTALVRPERGADAAPTGVDAAIELVAARLSAIPDEHGADAIALRDAMLLPGSPRCRRREIALTCARKAW